ncbi:MAG: lysophospholipid acyltransferase family protein [Candidatus Omnitrophica bacterium]|nr:lysophospholipid acyltransferase family protein [Candidatus Omnitrophota bacterium]
MFNYILYKIGSFIALSLPLKAAYRLAIFISDINYFFAYKDRRAVKENLMSIFPHKPPREICRIRLSMFRNFAKYLVDFFRFSELGSGYVAKNVRFENAHLLDEGLSKGKGVIIVTAHIGNWELGGVACAILGYPIWAVALPHKHKKVDDFFNAQRENRGLKVIPLGKAARMCLSVLSENKILALVGDRDFNENNLVLDFFGRPTYLPRGPALLALKTGSVIVPGFTLRNQDDTFTVRFDSPIEVDPSGESEKVLRALVNSYKTIIESYISRYPDQWFMFRRYWIP